MSTNLGKMKRGDDKTVQFTVDGSKLPVDGLASFTMWFTAKQQVSDLDADAQWEKVGAPGNLGDFTIVAVGDPESFPPTNGVVNCRIRPADTDQLPDYDVVLTWDFQLKDATGLITTSADGTLTVQPDITRTSV